MKGVSVRLRRSARGDPAGGVGPRMDLIARAEMDRLALFVGPGEACEAAAGFARS
jgi:hypothetical protein